MQACKKTITKMDKWYEVMCDDGTHYVRVSDVSESDEDGLMRLFDKLFQDSVVESYSTVDGYGSRVECRNYTTEWKVFDDEEFAIRHAEDEEKLYMEEEYGDRYEDDEDDGPGIMRMRRLF